MKIIIQGFKSQNDVKMSHIYSKNVSTQSSLKNKINYLKICNLSTIYKENSDDTCH